MDRYLTFFDVDGTYQVFKVISESNYLTHSVLNLYTVECLPKEKCRDYIGKLVRAILPYGWDRYIFMKIVVGKWARKEITVLSGTLKPFRGYLAFYPGYEYPVLLSKLEGKLPDGFYRDLYYSFRSEISEALDRLKEDIEKNIATISDVTKKFTEILSKYDEYLSRSIGILSRGSEALTLIETGLVQLTAPPPPAPPTPPPSPPTPPPKKGILERLKSLFRRGGVE